MNVTTIMENVERLKRRVVVTLAVVVLYLLLTVTSAIHTRAPMIMTMMEWRTRMITALENQIANSLMVMGTVWETYVITAVTLTTLTSGT